MHGPLSVGRLVVADAEVARRLHHGAIATRLDENDVVCSSHERTDLERGTEDVSCGGQGTAYRTVRFDEVHAGIERVTATYTDRQTQTDARKHISTRRSD